MFELFGDEDGERRSFGLFGSLEEAARAGHKVGPAHTDLPGLYGDRSVGTWAQVVWVVTGEDHRDRLTRAAAAEELSYVVIRATFRNTLIDLVDAFGGMLQYLSPAARARIRRDVFGGKPPAATAHAHFRAAWEVVSPSPYRCGFCWTEKKAGAYAVCPRCSTSDAAMALLGV